MSRSLLIDLKLDFQLDVRHVEQIRQHFSFLRENIFIDSTFSSYLRQRGVLSDVELQEIKLVPVRQRANDKLLTLIMRTSADLYRRFIDSLVDSKQGHVVQQLTATRITDLSRSNKFIYFKVVFLGIS